jgi:hypothetical protein
VVSREINGTKSNRIQLQKLLVAQCFNILQARAMLVFRMPSRNGIWEQSCNPPKAYRLGTQRYLSGAEMIDLAFILVFCSCSILGIHSLPPGLELPMHEFFTSSGLRESLKMNPSETFLWGNARDSKIRRNVEHHTLSFGKLELNLTLGTFCEASTRRS